MKKNNKEFLYVMYADDKVRLPIVVGETLEEFAYGIYRYENHKDPTVKDIAYYTQLARMRLSRAKQSPNPLYVKVEWDSNDEFKDIKIK